MLRRAVVLAEISDNGNLRRAYERAFPDQQLQMTMLLDRVRSLGLSWNGRSLRLLASDTHFEEEFNMSQVEPPVVSSVVAVYPDHESAECAVRALHQGGFAMADLSIVGRDFQVTEDPVGFASYSEYAKAGAQSGAWFGGLFGLFVGAAFLILPGVGPVVVAGPVAAAVVAGLEGALAGMALGSVGGALVGWGVPKERAIKYERHVKGGEFLLIARGHPEAVARAHALLTSETTEHVEVYHP